MSEHGITASNILRSLPIALQGDPSVMALSQATAEELAKRPAEIDLARIYAAIDRLPEAVLDILAYDFKIDWWDGNYSIDQKRRVFRNSFLVHRRLGTRWAVDTAIASVYPGSVTEEWFEYGGEPYHYRIFIETCREELNVVQVLKAAQRVKRLSAHCDSILFQCTIGLVIGTTAHGYKYHTLPTGVPLTGTWPQRNTIGAPQNVGIDIGTAAHGYMYSSPGAGTVPQRDTAAGIGDDGVDIVPTAQGYTYTAQAASEETVHAAKGGYTDTGAAVDADGAGYKYTVQNATYTGEKPNTQTVTTLNGSGFCTTVDTDFWGYAVRYCGNVYCNQTKDGILNRCY